jgi:hypothetical protein
MTKIGRFKTFVIDFVEKSIATNKPKIFIDKINAAKSFTEIDTALYNNADLNKENIYLMYKLFVMSDKC